MVIRSDGDGTIIRTGHAATNMDTIAELRLSADDFALKQTLEAAPSTRFETERVAAHDTEHVLPLVWATSDDLDLLEELLQEDSTVENVELLTSLDDEQLYRMKWVKNVHFIVHMLVEENAAILSCSGESDFWHFRVLFPDRQALSDTHDFCQRWNLGVTIERAYDLDSERHGRFGLTKEQSEVLVLALANGYYEIPRSTGTADLAEIIGISPQAVAERLRRAHRNVVQSSVTIGTEADEERKR